MSFHMLESTPPLVTVSYRYLRCWERQKCTILECRTLCRPASASASCRVQCVTAVRLRPRVVACHWAAGSGELKHTHTKTQSDTLWLVLTFFPVCPLHTLRDGALECTLACLAPRVSCPVWTLKQTLPQPRCRVSPLLDMVGTWAQHATTRRWSA